VLVWSALAVAALSLGEKFDRITLRFHGVGYLVAGASASGLLGAAGDGLLGAAGEAWRPVAPGSLVVAAVWLGGYALLLRGRERATLPAAVWPRAIVAALVVWSVAGLAGHLAASLLGRASGGTADAGVLSAARTAILSAIVVVLAWLGARRALPELAWLVYPLLIGTGAKLLLEDLRHGRPATLVWCLALYGGALIAAPRLLRGRS